MPTRRLLNFHCLVELNFTSGLGKLGFHSFTHNVTLGCSAAGQKDLVCLSLKPWPAVPLLLQLQQEPPLNCLPMEADFSSPLRIHRPWHARSTKFFH